MKYCPNCGNKCSDNANFCMRCGESFAGKKISFKNSNPTSENIDNDLKSIPETKKITETPPKPEIPEIVEIPQISETLETPLVLKVSETQFVLNLPEITETSEVPEEPESPERTESSEVTDPEEQFKLAKRYGEGNGVPEDEAEAVKWCKKAAEQGHAEAQCLLGDYYYYGEGVSKNQSEALKWYRKAAKQGNSYAQNEVGDCYYYGEGTSINYAEAFKWYKKAAEYGDSNAQFNVAKCYGDGNGVKKDKSGYVEWLKKAAENGHSEAQDFLGDCYYYGYGISKNYNESVRWYRKAIENGYDYANFCLGVCYEKGHGVEQNYVEAAKLYKKAAEKGYDDAQFNLAMLYSDGLGVNQSDEEAEKWIRRSAEKGNKQGQCCLGILCAENKNEAIKWFEKSAANGYEIAYCCLGILYDQWNGTVKNQRDADEIIKKFIDKGDPIAKIISEDPKSSQKAVYNTNNAKENSTKTDVSNTNYIPKDINYDSLSFCELMKYAEKGDAKAQFHLAMFYREGDDVEMDIEKMFEWLKKSAGNNCPEAQCYLGLYYAGNENMTDARKWLKKSIENGYKIACGCLGILFDEWCGNVMSKMRTIELISELAEQEDPIAEFLDWNPVLDWSPATREKEKNASMANAIAHILHAKYYFYKIYDFVKESNENMPIYSNDKMDIHKHKIAWRRLKEYKHIFTGLYGIGRTDPEKYEKTGICKVIYDKDGNFDHIDIDKDRAIDYLADIDVSFKTTIRVKCQNFSCILYIDKHDWDWFYNRLINWNGGSEKMYSSDYVDHVQDVVFDLLEHIDKFRAVYKVDEYSYWQDLDEDF